MSSTRAPRRPGRSRVTRSAGVRVQTPGQNRLFRRGGESHVRERRHHVTLDVGKERTIRRSLQRVNNTARETSARQRETGCRRDRLRRTALDGHPMTRVERGKEWRRSGRPSRPVTRVISSARVAIVSAALVGCHVPPGNHDEPKDSRRDMHGAAGHPRLERCSRSAERTRTDP